MITARAWSGRRYAVLGLARSGAATVQALLASGAEVVAWDEREEARLKLLPGTGRGTARAASGGGAATEGSGDPLAAGAAPAAEAAGPSTSFAGPPPRSGEDLLSFADPLTLDLTGFDGVVVSPGVPLNRHPIAAHARAHGVPVIGDIELFALARPELPAHKVVGITGTNGKSTTTALVHHILKTADVPTTMGGNIGLPILAQDPLPEGGVYVLELSSYQIDLTYSLDCDVAVLLNITPDHLDRYESFEAYRASKLRLFKMQRSDEPASALITEDDPALWRYALDHFDRPYAPISGADFSLFEVGFNQAEWPSLQGPHNASNASAAVLVCRGLGLPNDLIKKGLRSYPGLPHRMERVCERNAVLFVNDSKATNPDSAAPALAAYPQIHWIVGGQAKTDSLGPCEQHLDHVRAAYTIGEAGPMFARLLEGRVPVTQSRVLERAVTDAASAAVAGEVVLLSPACASFDQFRDYEERGNVFRAAVGALP